MSRFFKPTTFLLFLFSLCQSVFSQVGINTTTPDASSVLDITSTTQGMLTPRMTTVQRTAITTPANGLLVYDTDEGAFYYYENSIWNKLQSEIRDNYKLVKDISDLADELVAGGGSRYLLSSNYLYEINGTILVDFPIELNGAYVKGEDSVDDRLFNASGGTLFTGATGGNLKRMTIIGNGQQIFNITGTGAENLVCLAVNFVNASSVGSLSNLNLVFFNTGQFSNNTTGITANNVTSYFMSLFLWGSTNSGTFLTLTGTFSQIQITNSSVVVPAGVTGIDVSSNPTVGQGTLLNTAFSDAGTYVNGYTVGSYTGYNFNNDWFVNCPGLPLEADWNSTGYYYMTGNTTVTNFVTADVPVKIAGTTTASNLFRTSSATDNRLVYDGKNTREFEVVCTGTVDNDASSPNARIYEFVLRKIPSVGVPVTLSEISSERRFSNNDIGNFTLIGIVSLDPGDAIEVYASVNNVGGTLDTVVTRLSVVLK